MTFSGPFPPSEAAGRGRGWHISFLAIGRDVCVCSRVAVLAWVQAAPSLMLQRGLRPDLGAVRWDSSVPAALLSCLLCLPISSLLH